MDRNDLTYVRAALDAAATTVDFDVEHMLRALEIVELEIEENYGNEAEACEVPDSPVDSEADVVGESDGSESNSE